MKLRKVQKVQKKVQKKVLKNRCTFYYSHLNINSDKDKNKEKDKDKDHDEREKNYYKELCNKHVEKKGKKRYWSNTNTNRNGYNDNDLI
jgi:hypothetical protein